MKKIFVLILTMIFFSAKAQILSFGGNAYNENLPAGESICIPAEYKSGWIEYENGEKKTMNLKFKVSNQRILYEKDGKEMIVNGKVLRFGFHDGIDHIFRKIPALENLFLEVLNDAEKIRFLTKYDESEFENTQYSDVKRKIKELNQTYYLCKNEVYMRTKLNKKDFVGYFPASSDYLKLNPKAFKTRENLSTLMLFINGL